VIVLACVRAKWFWYMPGPAGVGHVDIQVARAFGAEVLATVSPDKKFVAEQYEATPIDYQTTPVESYVTEHTDGEGFDIAFDTVGGMSCSEPPREPNGCAFGSPDTRLRLS
jgi:threonine dehydrogenase-like Zn-dependent dehydrogenase